MDVSWLFTAAIAILVIYLLYKNISKNQGYWEKRGVPCMKGSHFSFIYMLFPKKPTMDMVMDVYKRFDGKKYYGSILLTTPVLKIRDPEIINLILTKDFTYFENRHLPMNEKLELPNAGLPHVAGDKWRFLRYKLLPTFTIFKMKKTMYEQIKGYSDAMVEFIKSKNGSDLEVKDLSFKFVVNVIGSIAFGINVDAFNEENVNDFLKMCEAFLKPTLFIQLKMILVFAAPKLKDFFKIKFVKKDVNAYFVKFIQDLIKYRKQNKERRNDFLQLLIDQQEKEILANSMANSKIESNIHRTDSEYIMNHAEEPEDMELLEHLKYLKYDKNTLVFSDYIIAAQTFVFISGGSESTASTLSFTLHYLVVNKKVQKKVQQEVDDVLLKHELNYEASKKMKYLEQVFYEVLRLHTPGSVISRLCSRDYKIPGTDVVVEKGTIIQIPVYAIHRDPQYFSNPETFDPDRFDDMNSIPKNVFFPFGGGPRMCIAMRLVLLELKIAVASLLRSFDIIHSEKTPLPLLMKKYSFKQEAVGGLWVKFQERKQQFKCTL